MRIALLNNYGYSRGGAERVFLEERRFLGERGHQVDVFTQAMEENEPLGDSENFPRKIRFEKLGWLGRIATAPKIIYSNDAARRFDQWLRKIRPDVIHAHNIYGGLTTSVLDVAKSQGVPVVMTLHDYKLVCPSYLMLSNGEPCLRCLGGGFHHCVLTRCHKDNLAASLVYAAESYFNRLFDKYGWVGRFLCPSVFLLNIMRQGGWPREKLVHLPNAIGLDRHQPTYSNRGYFLYAGRLSKEKGILTLLRAAAMTGLPLRVVGTGPLWDECKAFIEENHATRIDMVGYAQGEALWEEYRGAMAVVLPSEWFENAPMSILEAYAMGKPVIASRIGGNPEMVRDGQTGFLYPMGDARQLAEKMNNMASVPGLSRLMGWRARLFLERRHSAEGHYEKLMEVLEGAALCESLT